MAAAGGGHASGFKDVLLQERFIGNAGEPLHQQGQQIVACVGVFQLFARSEGGLQFGFAKEAQNLIIAWDSVFFLPDVDEPVRVVKVIGHAAGVGEQVTDRYVFVGGELREIMNDSVIQAQQSLPHYQHDGSCRELFADRSKLEDCVFLDRQRVVRIPETHGAFRDDFAVLGVEPCPVEAAFFVRLAGKAFHQGFLIHDCFLLNLSRSCISRRRCHPSLCQLLP